jgi:RNA polymerase sigma-70 factor, ECF subfamily
MSLEEVYDTYIDTVYKFFYIHSFDRALAEDLTSQTFLAFAESFDRSDTIREPKKFLYGIMRNVWLMHLREKYRRNEAFIEEIDNFPHYVEKEIDEYQSLPISQRAQEFISKLPEQQQRIVYMKLIEDIAIKDIAKEIGKDRGYVKTTYKRGLKNLRKLFEQYAAGEEVSS